MTSATTAPVTAALAALYEELAAEIPNVLTETFTFAGLWADLCRIVGEPLPRDVATVLDAPLDLVPVPVPIYRGAFAEHALQFPELYAD